MKEETEKLLDKAARAVHAAETLFQAADVEFAAGRAYYAVRPAAHERIRPSARGQAYTGQ